MQTFSLSFLLWPLNRIKVSSRSEKGKFQQCVGRGNHFLTLEAAALIQGPHHRAVGFPDTQGALLGPLLSWWEVTGTTLC